MDSLRKKKHVSMLFLGNSFCDMLAEQAITITVEIKLSYPTDLESCCGLSLWIQLHQLAMGCPEINSGTEIPNASAIGSNSVMFR